MTEDQREEIWNALQLAKTVNHQLYMMTYHIEGAKEGFKDIDETLTKAMKTLGQIGQKETTE